MPELPNSSQTLETPFNACPPRPTQSLVPASRGSKLYRRSIYNSLSRSYLGPSSMNVTLGVYHPPLLIRLAPKSHSVRSTDPSWHLISVHLRARNFGHLLPRPP